MGASAGIGSRRMLLWSGLVVNSEVAAILPRPRAEIAALNPVPSRHFLRVIIHPVLPYAKRPAQITVALKRACSCHAAQQDS
jgi:hypothetical protein